MRKQPTGEPYAGEPHVRFGGRGGASLPYPYQAPSTSRITARSRSQCPCGWGAIEFAEGSGLGAGSGLPRRDLLYLEADDGAPFAAEFDADQVHG
jgi:hypothetical protein